MGGYRSIFICLCFVVAVPAQETFHPNMPSIMPRRRHHDHSAGEICYWYGEFPVHDRGGDIRRCYRDWHCPPGQRYTCRRYSRRRLGACCGRESSISYCYDGSYSRGPCYEDYHCYRYPGTYCERHHGYGGATYDMSGQCCRYHGIPWNSGYRRGGSATSGPGGHINTFNGIV